MVTYGLYSEMTAGAVRDGFFVAVCGGGDGDDAEEEGGDDFGLRAARAEELARRHCMRAKPAMLLVVEFIGSAFQVL